MQLTPQQVLPRCAPVFQQTLFPALEAEIGPLSQPLKLLSAVVNLVPLGLALSSRQASTGRPPRDRSALATAFLAKSILNLSTTRQLIDRLKADAQLRRLCGWDHIRALPHESKFSRAFAQFANSELPQQLHAAVIHATQGERLIGHIARDSTAIQARERIPDERMEEKRRYQAANPSARKARMLRPRQPNGAHASIGSGIRSSTGRWPICRASATSAQRPTARVMRITGAATNCIWMWRTARFRSRRC